LASFLLGYLKETAETFLRGVRIEQAVVSVPVFFNERQRKLTEDACKQAGLKVTMLISEPLAACISSVLSVSKPSLFGCFQAIFSMKRNVLVFDLGGGTLDLSMNRAYSTHNVHILGTDGNTRLGGNDFDQRILYHFLSQLRAKHEYDFEGDKAAMYLLIAESEKAKQHLSTNEKYSKDFQYGGLTTDLSITRMEFEEVCHDLFERIEERVLNFLRNGMHTDYVGATDCVVLVGGSSQMPQIRSLLEKIIGRYESLQIDPHETVASGAAIQAMWSLNLLQASLKIASIMNFDSVPFSLGIENCSGELDILIKRNTELPCKITKFYERIPFKRDQDQVLAIVKVYEGEEKMTIDNYFKGLLQCHVSAPTKIEVTIHVDIHQRIELTIKDVRTGLETSKRVSREDDEVRDAELEKLKSEEKIRRLLATQLNSLDSTKPKMTCGDLVEIFEKSLITPIDSSIAEIIENLNEASIGKLVDVSFEFPFDGCDSKVTQLKLLRIFKSNAKPKQLLCLPMGRKVIFKKGDNLHDDQICMAFLNVFNAIWEHSEKKFEWKVI